MMNSTAQGQKLVIDEPDNAKADEEEVTGSSLLVRIGKRLRPGIDKILARQSKVGDPPVFNKADFDFVHFLEENWQTIADEAQSIVKERDGVHSLVDVSPDHQGIADDKRWKSFFLVGYGYRIDHNCDRCPKTAELLEHIPGLFSAFFSILEAGAEIPAHRGVTKAILTSHLGLSIPKDRDSIGIRVDDKVLRWEEGKVLIFDDTFDHEAWNRTDEDRIVLLMHVKRPMRSFGRWLGGLFLAGARASTFVQDARKNLVEKDIEQGFKASSQRWKS